MRRTGQVLACCSMKANVTWASPRRCRSLFLGRRAPGASGRVHAADGRSRRLGRRGTPPSSQARLPVTLLPAVVGSHPSAPSATASASRVGSRDRLAICVCGRPLLSRRATASRLNSGVNSRRVLAIKHLPRPQGAYQRCRGSGGRSYPPPDGDPTGENHASLCRGLGSMPSAQPHDWPKSSSGSRWPAATRGSPAPAP
jgi:hypothetical protein